MRIIYTYALAGLLAGLLAGCVDTNDLLGVTDRAQIRANAAVAVAEAHRDEAVGVAHESASVGRAWAGTLPFVVLVIVAGALGALLINWQGQIYLERTKQLRQAQLPAPELVEGPQLLRARPGHDAWLLPDGTIRVRRLRDDAVFTIEQTDPLYSRLITDKAA